MRVLLVEDEPTLAQQITAALTPAGMVVDHAADGLQGHYLGSNETYDCVILDLGLPGLDGLSVLKRWRAEGMAVPVLILTARDAWTDKVEGIDAGADDYLAKPFQMQELLARVRALIRRAHGLASAIVQVGPLSLDTRRAQLYRNGELIALTPHEYRIIAYLMHRAGEVVSQTSLVEHIYAQDFDRDSNTIEVFIARLRRKLGSDRIETIRGLGYRLRTE